MKNQISSCITFIYKLIFPVIWITGFGLFAVFRLINNKSFDITIIWILGTAFIYWGCIRLKYIEIDNEYLYISNYIKKIKVQRSNIEKVSENVFISTHPVWIHFKNPTDFGKKIIFMPTVRIFSFFSSHPIVKELRNKVYYNEYKNKNYCSNCNRVETDLKYKTCTKCGKELTTIA